jgi:hypothetical protein
MDELTPDLAHTPAKPEGGDEPPPRPPTRLRKFIKRLTYFGIGLLIIAVVIFFMLPVWMSNEQGRNYLLGRFNKRINGKVTVGSWNLSWFSGTDIRNMVLTSADGKVILSSPHIKTDLTLWSLLWGNYDLGNTIIDSPQITATTYADGTNDFSRLILPSPPPGPNPLMTLRAYITWNNGLAVFTGPATQNRGLRIEDFAGEIPIASNSAPIHMKARGASAGIGSNQPVNLLADLPPPVTWTENPYPLLFSMKLTAGNIPTAPLAEWAGLSSGWSNSIGPVITSLAISTTPVDADTQLTLSLHGTMGTVEMYAWMKTAEAGGRRSLRLEMDAANTAKPPLTASLRLSQPLTELLAHVNPLLSGLYQVDDAIMVTIEAMSIDLHNPKSAAGKAFLKLPRFTLYPTPLMKEILALSSAPTEGPVVIQDINGISLNFGNQHVSVPDVVMMLPSRQRLTFSGSIGFDGNLDLILKTPLPSSPGSASVSTVTLPIGGKVHSPKMAKP